MEIINWEDARNWESNANKGKVEEAPSWSWDCNFKLDFDGDILKLNSRFYPPTRVYGKNWNGKVTFTFMGTVVMEKNFECETLEKLKKEVESFVKHYTEIIKGKLI